MRSLGMLGWKHGCNLWQWKQVSGIRVENDVYGSRKCIYWNVESKRDYRHPDVDIEDVFNGY